MIGVGANSGHPRWTRKAFTQTSAVLNSMTCTLSQIGLSNIGRRNER